MTVSAHLDGHAIILTVRTTKGNVLAEPVPLGGSDDPSYLFSEAAKRLHERLKALGEGLPLSSRDKLAMKFEKARKEKQ